MAAIRNISAWIDSHITLLVVAVTALALLVPASFVWIGTSTVTPLLGIIMFGMGLTLRPADFIPVFKRPKDILIGELAQFIVMPSLAWLLCRLLHLPDDIALGVILVGCCPGGTASNIMCFLAQGDVALSVAMTAVSTLLAPLLCPALVWLLAHESIDIHVWGMFLSIIQVVILPIILGFAVQRFLGKTARNIVPYLPTVSTLAVAAIIGTVVSHNSANILSCSLLVGIAVVLHNLAGLSVGYLFATLAGLEKPKRTAVSIEVGMQNSGLATSLAATHFALYPMATVPGALFSVWHNFSGSLAAAWFRRRQGQPGNDDQRLLSTKA